MPFIPPPSMTAPPPAADMAGLSGMSLNQPADSPVASAPLPADGSVMKMFYSIERALESLASAVPKEAGKLDIIKSSLREVLNSVLSEGPQQDQSPNLLKGGTESY